MLSAAFWSWNLPCRLPVAKFGSWNPAICLPVGYVHILQHIGAASFHLACYFQVVVVCLLSVVDCCLLVVGSFLLHLKLLSVVVAVVVIALPCPCPCPSPCWCCCFCCCGCCWCCCYWCMRLICGALERLVFFRCAIHDPLEGLQFEKWRLRKWGCKNWI